MRLECKMKLTKIKINKIKSPSMPLELRTIQKKKILQQLEAEDKRTSFDLNT